MSKLRQPEKIGVGVQMSLRFSGKLDIYRRMKGLTISALAKKLSFDPGHLEYLLEGKHQPRAWEAFRIMETLKIEFSSKDFEEGLP